MNKPNLLIVEDDKDLIKEVGLQLEDDFVTESALSLSEAKGKLEAAEYTVVVADRKLPDSDDGPRDLIKHLESRRVRPEIVVLTAYANMPNANKLFREGIFSYIEKASGPEVYNRLREDCGKANLKWYQRNRRIPEWALKDTMAILFGDILSFPNSADSSEFEEDSQWVRDILDGEAWEKGGYLIKLALPTFMAAFDSVFSAVNMFEGIKEVLKSRSQARFGAPLQIHAAIGWGKVTKVQRTYGDELVGLGVSETVKLLNSHDNDPDGNEPDRKVPPGKYKLSVSAERQRELEGKPPVWVEFALREADRLINASLPEDLSERHDDHSMGDLR